MKFVPVTTDNVEIHLIGGTPRYSVLFSGGVERLPVGISEISVPETNLYPQAMDTGRVELKCGSGPVVAVDGIDHQTSVTATRAELLAGATVPAKICGGGHLVLAKGRHRITITGSDVFRPVDYYLTKTPASHEIVATSATGTASRFELPAGPTGPRLVVADHNVNAGWLASVRDGSTTGVAANGWQQGWIVNGGHGPVSVHFGPDRTYRIGLLVGAFALLGLLVCAIRRGRTDLPAAVERTPRRGRPWSDRELGRGRHRFGLEGRHRLHRARCRAHGAADRPVG